jgi:hypothetical protein
MHAPCQNRRETQINDATHDKTTTSRYYGWFNWRAVVYKGVPGFTNRVQILPITTRATLNVTGQGTSWALCANISETDKTGGTAKSGSGGWKTYPQRLRQERLHSGG